MCSAGSDWTCLQPGFPIRKSSDQSLVIDSPRLIADSYVLLRFLVPRHPPCALINLSHKDARVHCVVLNIRSVPRRALAPAARCAVVRPATRSCRSAGHEVQAVRPSPQDPTTCQARVRRPWRSVVASYLYLPMSVTLVPNNRCSTLEHLVPDVRRHDQALDRFRGQCSLERR